MTSPEKIRASEANPKTEDNENKPTSKRTRDLAIEPNWWTIPQTLAWIIVRDHAVVRGVLPSMTPFNILAYFIETQSTFDEMPNGMLPALAARDDFYTQCKSGALTVWASRTHDGPMEAISAADWPTIDALAGNNPQFPHNALGGLYEDSPRYFRALISSSDVLAIWPEYALKRTPDFEIKEVVEEAIRKFGRRLTVEEVDELEVKFRTENCTVPQRKKFREALIALRGKGERGRPRLK